MTKKVTEVVCSKIARQKSRSNKTLVSARNVPTRRPMRLSLNLLWCVRLSLPFVGCAKTVRDSVRDHYGEAVKFVWHRKNVGLWTKHLAEAFTFLAYHFVEYVPMQILFGQFRRRPIQKTSPALLIVAIQQRLAFFAFIRLPSLIRWLLNVHLTRMSCNLIDIVTDVVCIVQLETLLSVGLSWWARH